VGSRILITGGAGFIGSHLVDHLIGDGYAVTVLDDFSTGKRIHLAEASRSGDLRVIEGSILDLAAVSEAMQGCELVYHLAVQCVRRSIGRPLENHHVNATGTLQVLEDARRRKVRRFVYCSSSEVYGNASSDRLDEEKTVCAPATVYGAAKLVGELYTQVYRTTYGLPVVVVRPFNAYGPREHCVGDLAEVIPRFVIRVLNGRPPVIFGTGEQGRDFTYVSEVARGLALAGRSDAVEGKIVNIARGELITIREVAQKIAELCQRPDLAPVYMSSRPGDVHRLHARTDRARELMAYRATISFEEGLERYLNWFTRTHPDPSKLLEEEDPINWVVPEGA
jgi:UDP-glucose 4-epimerase